MAEMAGSEALVAIDRVLADRPNKVGHDFSGATRHLAIWRDILAHRWRQSAAERDRRALDKVNAALSVILGGQFPLGEVPWPEIERVREDLRDLVNAEVDQRSTASGNSCQTTRS
jgi:formate dehydrogenase major subunit